MDTNNLFRRVFSYEPDDPREPYIWFGPFVSMPWPVISCLHNFEARLEAIYAKNNDLMFDLWVRQPHQTEFGLPRRFSSFDDLYSLMAYVEYRPWDLERNIDFELRAFDILDWPKGRSNFLDVIAKMPLAKDYTKIEKPSGVGTVPEFAVKSDKAAIFHLDHAADLVRSDFTNLLSFGGGLDVRWSSYGSVDIFVSGTRDTFDRVDPFRVELRPNARPKFVMVPEED